VRQVIVGRPFREFELPDEDWLHPPIVFHLGRRQSCTPPATSRLGEVRERTFLALERLQLLEQLPARQRRESVACARGILKLPVIVVAEYQRIEVPVRWCVPADHEFLTTVDSHFLPGAGPLARLIAAVAAFSRPALPDLLV